MLPWDVVIERILRVAKSFDEARAMDQEDVAALSFEERISGVERLRREWFGEARGEPLTLAAAPRMRRSARAPQRLWMLLQIANSLSDAHAPVCVSAAHDHFSPSARGTR